MIGIFYVHLHAVFLTLFYSQIIFIIMSYKKKKKERSYTCRIKISATKKRNIEMCAKAQGITLNRFIKDAINQSLTEVKALQAIEDNGILKNQLKLFDMEECLQNETQLSLDL
ncbi:MAG: hypothetical protein LBG80_02345 [Bacteroidales bacterium]|jgi:hypothetical protein|nr:hypothetical protein [Bacteroidales bacterium]